ncbi:MAG TPA: reverse transcriptase domain-containing protein, partial [Nakamurella sp.]
MSRAPCDTPRSLHSAVAQRHLETEVANCVGGVISPLIANIFLHHGFDAWMTREYPGVQFERFADDVVVHCVTERQARQVR